MRTTAERFWNLVRTSSPDVCWEWQGNLDRDGYGRFRLDGKLRKAHRVAALIDGKLADINPTNSTLVLHTCHNRKCVNPSHLHIGTQKDNMTDMAKANRAPRRHRSKHDDIKETIRQLAKAGRGPSSIARALNVEYSFVSAFLKRENI